MISLLWNLTCNKNYKHRFRISAPKWSNSCCNISNEKKMNNSNNTNMLYCKVHVYFTLSHKQYLLSWQEAYPLLCTLECSIEEHRWIGYKYTSAGRIQKNNLLLTNVIRPRANTTRYNSNSRTFALSKLWDKIFDMWPLWITVVL